MARHRPLIVLAVAAVALLAACGSSGSKSGAGNGGTTSTTAAASSTTAGGGGKYSGGGTTTTAATSSTTSGGSTSGAIVSTATTSLGKVLVDSTGHTLYEYQPDPMGSSTCTGACAGAWPPLTATGTVSVGGGLTASMFKTVNGGVVAVNGHPLYRFAGDTKAGDTNGQGVANIWHAAGADGNPIMG